MLSLASNFDPDVAISPRPLGIISTFRTVGVRVHLIREERVRTQTHQLFVFHR